MRCGGVFKCGPVARRNGSQSGNHFLQALKRLCGKQWIHLWPGCMESSWPSFSGADWLCFCYSALSPSLARSAWSPFSVATGRVPELVEMDGRAEDFVSKAQLYVCTTGTVCPEEGMGRVHHAICLQTAFRLSSLLVTRHISTADITLRD